MKRDARAVRGYNLKQNLGDYKSRDNLRGWWRFDPEKYYQNGDKWIPNAALTTVDAALSVASKPVGQYLTLRNVAGSSTDPAPLASRLQSESYMPGAIEPRVGSVIFGGNDPAANKGEYLDWRPIPVASWAPGLESDEWTISLWFKFPEQSSDEGIHPSMGAGWATTLCKWRMNAGATWNLEWDSGGGGGTNGAFIVNSTLSATGTTGAATYQITPANASLPGNMMRGWNNITIVGKTSVAGQCAQLPADWTLYFNGIEISGVTNISNTRETADVLTSFKFGDPGESTPSLSTVKMAVGEIAIWDTNLSALAIEALYEAATTSANTGFVSLGPMAKLVDDGTAKDAYPTIGKSTDQDRLNRTEPAFDDQTATIDYGVAFGDPVNFPTLLRSGSDYLSRQVATPHDVPNIYVGGKGAKATLTVVDGASPETDLNGQWFRLTDGKGRIVRFKGDNTANTPSRVSALEYTFGILGIDALATALLRQVETATRIKAAIALSFTSGDLSIVAFDDPISTYALELTQTTRGTVGNTRNDTSAGATGFLGIDPAFTGGTGTPGAAKVVSSVVGDYSADMKPTFADPVSPFNDAREPVNIALRPAYLPDFAPGFTKTVGDRVMIEIDITPRIPKVLAVLTGTKDSNDVWRTDEGGPQGAGNFQTPLQYTGLAYFNFDLRQWDSVGGEIPRENKTPVNVSWQLPMECTGGSEAHSDHFDPDMALKGPCVRNANSRWANERTDGGTSVWYASQNFILAGSPRIFQPFTSIFAHRSTFNLIYDKEYMKQPGAPGTGTKYKVSDDGMGGVLGDPYNYLPAIEGAVKWATAYPESKLGYSDDTKVNDIRWNHDVINEMTTDLQGLSKGVVTDKISGSWDLNKNIYANTPTSTSGTIFTNALNHHLGAMGLPIAYTRFSTNPRFYASSSQLLNLSDYLQVPMLLESVAIETDVDVRRAQYTEIEVGASSRGSSFDSSDPNAELGAWSTTCNYVDNLTFFLMRQVDNSDLRPAGKAATIRSAGQSRRELITWTNNVFYSPFIGWDFWQSWSHPYAYAGDNFPQPRKGGRGGVNNTGGAGPDGKWPFPQTTIGDPADSWYVFAKAQYPLSASVQTPWGSKAGRAIFSCAYYPMAGRRARRVFELNDETILNNVEACDTATAYHTSPITAGGAQPSTQPLAADGQWGVFWSFEQAPEALTGIPHIADRMRTHATRSDGSKREYTYFSASTHISTHFPVRICGPYAQHDTPVVAADTFCGYGDGTVNANASNIWPTFMKGNPGVFTADWVFYDWTGGGTVTFHGKPHYSGLAGWDWTARGGIANAAGANSPSVSGPREYLACYGRYWPGGVKTSEKTRTPNSYIPMTGSNSVERIGFVVPGVMGGYGNPRPAKDTPYPQSILSDARSHSSRVYHIEPNTRLMAATPNDGGSTGIAFSRNIGVSVPTGWRGSGGASVDGGIFMASSTTIVPPQYQRNRPLGQGLTGYAPNFAKYDITGSNVYNSAQILMPEDNLVLGVQWTPADPAHQSFRETMKTLTRNASDCRWRGRTYADITGTGSLKVDNDCVFTGWGNVRSTTYDFATYGGRAGVSNRNAGYELTYPKYGWNATYEDPDNLGYPRKDSFKSMEYQYRFLGWDSSNDLEAYMKNQSCTIKSTPQIIRLYGVLLKDQKQYHQPLSQQVKTLGVHQALSNGSVIDQFQPATNVEYRRSAAARIFSGSITAPDNAQGGPGLVTKWLSKESYGYGIVSGLAQRGVYRSAYASAYGNEGAYQLSSPLYDIGAIKRHALLVDLSEVYYDSMCPDVEQLWAKDGYRLLERDEIGYPSAVPWAVWAYTHVGDTAYNAGHRMSHCFWKLGPEGKYAPNDRWPLAFPFEPRYHGVARRLEERPLKVAGIIDRQPSAFVVGNVTSDFGIYGSETNKSYKGYGKYQENHVDESVSIPGMCMWTGFSWATGDQQFPIRALASGLVDYGSYTPHQNEFMNAFMGQQSGFSTQWTGTNGGLMSKFTTGSSPRNILNYWLSFPGNTALVPGDLAFWKGPGDGSSVDWQTNPANPTYDPETGYVSWVSGSGYGTSIDAVDVPRYGASCTVGSYRNSGYVFYPHYARVMTPRVKNTDQSDSWSPAAVEGTRFLRSFTMRDATGPDWTPPMQFSHQSGAFGEKCVKNHIFGVGSLMFAPEPIFVVMSSSQDVVANSLPQFTIACNKNNGTTADAGGTGIPKKHYWDSFGNVAHLDFFCGKPRGWRYGLINAFPTRPTCAFRKDHYGQFRDMLEQRHYAPYYVNDPPDIAMDRRQTPGLFARVRKTPRRLDYPVYCTFKTPAYKAPLSTTRVPPADTQSSNLSLYATSSLPYFDGEVKNRGALPPADDVIIA